MAALSESPWADRKHPDVLCLFDVDGTLTLARRLVTSDMLQFLKDLRKKVVIGFVGGSDLAKQKEQLGENVIELFDYAFPENGLQAYRKGHLLTSESFIGWIGEEKYKTFVNYLLAYLSKLDIPKKRGTFIEFRNGMINVSPIGRNCSHAERDEFEAYDKIHGIRKAFVEDLKKTFPDLGLTYSIGGQISFDVFPTGWDKTYCLKHVAAEGFKTIHFCGDKTFEGGNDFEIFHHPLVTGHAVTNPDDTKAIMSELFFKTA